LLTYSLDVESVDTVIFILEWLLYLHHGGPLNLVKLVSKVPKSRRIVIDCDGMYNDVVRIDGDYNHLDPAASRRWIELCDGLSDKIYQPTLHPLRPNVGTFLFHAYDPIWEVPLDFCAKEYGMVYVGNNWFRWRALQRLLETIEPVREQVGRIALVGYSWDAMPYWVESPLRETACYTDPVYLQRLDVEIMPPVPVEQVINSMSQGVFSPVLVRPLFNHLGLVTCRTFETPAANTIPLFNLDEEYVREIYGEQALELVLGPRAVDQILDVLLRPEHYAEIVRGIRHHLNEHHSYSVRLQELIEIVGNPALGE
jgi:hypothetical protein